MQLRFEGNQASIEGLTPQAIGAASQGGLNALAASTNNSINSLTGEIQKRPLALKSDGVRPRTLTTINEETLWTKQLSRAEYTENSSFEMHGLFRFTNNANSKRVNFKMNGVNILSIPNVSKACCSYKRIVFNLGLKQQVSYPLGTNGDWGETAVTESIFTIDTSENIIFSITTVLAVASDLATLLGAYVRVNY